jgi:hypothetical protein
MTSEGGSYYACGVGSALMGRGAHIFLIDDPFGSMAEACSEIERKAVHSWYQGTVYNRLEKGGAIVIVNRRPVARFRVHGVRPRGRRSLPDLAGHPMTAHWGIPDPAEATGAPTEVAVAFQQAYRMLHRRIEAFAALPVRSLDQLSLQSKLREIGRMAGATGKISEPH